MQPATPLQTSTTRVVVTNPNGLRLPTAALLAKTARAYRASVALVHEGQRVDAKSITEILSLEVAPGAEITVTAEGPDAGRAVRAIDDLFACPFRATQQPFATAFRSAIRG